MAESETDSRIHFSAVKYINQAGNFILKMILIYNRLAE